MTHDRNLRIIPYNRKLSFKPDNWRLMMLNCSGQWKIDRYCWLLRKNTLSDFFFPLIHQGPIDGTCAKVGHV